MADAALGILEDSESEFALAKLTCADYYFQCMLPQIRGIESMLAADSQYTMAMTAAWF